MLKLIGCGCVLTAGVRLFWRTTAEERRRAAVLYDLAMALEFMADEIRMNRTPIPRLLLKAGTDRCSEVMDYFAKVRISSREMGLSAAWRQASDMLSLPEQEQKAFWELGSCLTGDEEQACRGLRSVSEQLDRALKRRRAVATENTKRNAALCLSGAALMIILLI